MLPPRLARSSATAFRFSSSCVTLLAPSITVLTREAEARLFGGAQLEGNDVVKAIAGEIAKNQATPGTPGTPAAPGTRS